MTLLPIHIIAGLTGLISGMVALFAVKGGKLHRRSGVVFVYAMIVLGCTGAAIGAMKGQKINVIAGSLTFYLVTSALHTVRRQVWGFDWKDVGIMLLGLSVGL